MTYVKGDRTILTRSYQGYDPGAKGRIIRFDTHYFAADEYAVLLDEDGAVLQNLHEDDVFVTDPVDPQE